MANTPVRPGFVQEYNDKKQKEEIEIQKDQKKEQNKKLETEAISKQDAIVERKPRKTIAIAGISALVICVAGASGLYFTNKSTGSNPLSKIANIAAGDSSKAQSKALTDEEYSYQDEAKSLWKQNKDEFNVTENKFTSDYIQYRNEGLSAEEAFSTIENDYAIINFSDTEEVEAEEEKEAYEGSLREWLPLPSELAGMTDELMGKGTQNNGTIVQDFDEEPMPETKVVTATDGNDYEIEYNDEIGGYAVEITDLE